MRERMVGHAAHGYRRGGLRTPGRPYGPPIPPPFLALALLAAFALGRASGMKRRFGRPWGPSARGCAGPSSGPAGRPRRRGEEPPVVV